MKLQGEITRFFLPSFVGYQISFYLNSKPGEVALKTSVDFVVFKSYIMSLSTGSSNKFSKMLIDVIYFFKPFLYATIINLIKDVIDLSGIRQRLIVLYEFPIRALFCSPHHQFFWKINENLIIKRLEYQPERFNFKFILRVIV